MLLLRLCMLPRLMYFMQSLPPRYMKEATIQFDRAIVKAFSDIVEIQTDEMPLTTHEKFQIGLKVSKGGVGLRSMLLVLYAAYFSSVVPVLPHLKKLLTSRKHDLSHSPTQADLLECVQELKQQGITDEQMMMLGITKTPLIDAPDTAQAINQLWYATSEEGCTPHFQHKLTQWIEDREYMMIFCPPYLKTILCVLDCLVPQVKEHHYGKLLYRQKSY